MKALLIELKGLLSLPFAEFDKVFTNVRSAERNFQLIIELASDINTHIVVESGGETPDTYRESFKSIANLKIVKDNLLPEFIKSSNLRNVLIHEYDFDEDNFIFYNSSKSFVPLYVEYIDSVKIYLGKGRKN